MTLSTHVLDATSGRAAVAVSLDLDRRTRDDWRQSEPRRPTTTANTRTSHPIRDVSFDEDRFKVSTRTEPQIMARYANSSSPRSAWPGCHQNRRRARCK
jgi:5-hydroxyisourate hydrolase-like protein (transthyretin family)